MDKLWDMTERSTGCWLWTGCKTGGYGRIFFEGKRMRAHRVAWMVTYGPIPDGLFVLHRCDNPACINPEHLYLGTNRDNMLDMVSKGRKRGGKPVYGEKNGSAKLTWNEVLAIREEHIKGLTERELTEKFGITKSQIHKIVAHQNWRE